MASMSSSYAEYLREIALETNGMISREAAAATASARTPPYLAAHTRVEVSHHTRPPRRAAAAAARTGHIPRDPTANTYECDFLQAPSMGSVSRAHAVRQYEQQQQQQQRSAATTLRRDTQATSSSGGGVSGQVWRDAGIPTAPGAAPLTRPSTITYTSARRSASASRREGRSGSADHAVSVKALQRSFQRLYASMQDEGRRGASSSQLAEAQPRRASSSRPSPSQPQPQLQQRRTNRVSAVVSARAIRVPDIDFDAYAVESYPKEEEDRKRGYDSAARSACGCRGHTTAPVSHDAVPVKSALAGSSSARRATSAVMVVSPIMTSTDSSAITGSPTRDGDRGAGAASTSASSLNTSRDGAALHNAHRRAAAYRCPHCCHRCDSCHCTGRPCQANVQQQQQRQALRSASPSSDVRVVQHVHHRGAVCRDGARAQETVRLRWPGQPSPTTSPTTPSSSPSSRRPSPRQEARPASRRTSSRTRHSRHTRKRGAARAARRDGDDEAHAPHSATAVVSSTTAATRKSRREATAHGGEAVLREVAARTCACYWSDFPDLPMAVNPAAHAASCPYQAHEALYAEVMLAPSSNSSRVSSSRSSSSSSSSSSATSTGLRGRRRGDAGRASARARRRASPPSGRGQLARQPRSALADAEVTLPRARAAVIGSSKRRTYMELLMDAARDAPAPPPSSAEAHPPAEQPHALPPLPPSAPPPPAPAPAAADGPAATEVAHEGDAALSGAADGAAADGQDAAHDTTTVAVVAPAAAAAEAEIDEVVEEVPPATEAVGGSAEPKRGDGDADDAAAAVPSPQQEHSATTMTTTASPLRALSRPRMRPRRGVPGPGAYHVDEAFAVSSAARGPRGAAMARAPRMPPVRATTPGPGAYDMYKHEEEERRAVVVTAITVAEKAGGAGAVAAAGGAEGVETGDGEARADAEAASAPADGAGEPGASAGVKTTIGKGVAFASTSARQLQLQYGDAYVRAAAWARRAAAVPGPGAYNFVDGDRVDQSKAPGTARQGFRFPKSADGAHFTGAPPTAEAAAPINADAAAAPAGDAGPPGARAAAAAAALRASLVLPWRDWAGGAFIGTSTAAFVAHPSLATRDRRVVGQPVDDADAAALRGGASGGDGSAFAAAAAASACEGGSVWRGVGSGVALRLTSQRFPAAPADDARDDEDGGGAGVPRGRPGPASYETASGLRWVQRRAPAAHMAFRPRDRGPRGPLRSLATSSAEAADPLYDAAATLPLFASTSPFLYGDGGRLAPGPGTYDVHRGEAAQLRRSPQWSFGTAVRAAAAADAAARAADTASSAAADASTEAWAPGPGAYDTAAAYRALQPAPRSVLLGTAPRFPQPADSSMYAGAAGADGVAEELRTGPGAYDVESGLALVRPRVKGGVVPRAGAAESAALRDEADGAGLGPGAYTLPVLPALAPTAILGSTAPRFPWERVVDEDRADSFQQQGTTPGPGAYDVDAAATLASRPSAIIGRAPRGLLAVPRSEDAGVGPGSYSLPALPAGRAAVMLTAPTAAGGADGDPVTAAAAAGEGPGPGLYDPVDPRAAAPRSFSLARTSQRFADAPGRSEDVPGPGAYEVGARGPWGAQSSAGGVAFSTAPRFADAVGGDGHSLSYSSSNAAGALIEAGMGMGRSFSGVVGPGSYDPRHPEGPLAPSYSIARAPRFAAGGPRDGEGVGPGTYEVVDLSPPTRSAVMGTAAAHGAGADATTQRDIPGPGAYSLQYTQVEATAPRVVLGRAPTDRGGGSGAGGAGVDPGQYDPQYPTDVVYATPGHTFGTAPRVGLNGDVGGAAGAGAGAGGGPGPGAYEVDRTRDGHVVSAAASPGVGGYGGPTFGTAPRFAAGVAAAGGGEGSSGTQLSAGPGPGAYMPEVGLEWLSTTAASHAARFATAPRMLGEEMHSNAAGAAAASGPGPGAYEPNTGVTHPTVPSVSFARADIARGESDHHHHHSSSSHTPGPGAYVMDDTADGTAYGVRAAHFGSAPRFAHDGAAGAGGAGAVGGDGPGPGLYEPNDTATRPAVPSHRFGTAPRAPHDASPEAEAAGAGAAASVGPGAYDIATGLARSSQWATPAAFSFPRAAGQGAADAAAAAALVDAASPGPGAYSLEAAYRATLPRTAAVAFATAPGHPSADHAMPDGGEGGGGGGGDGASFSPGPGAYQVPPAFPGGPSWGFGTAARQAGGPADAGVTGAASTTPGPSAYAVPPPPPLHGGVSIPHAASTTATATTGTSANAATSADPTPGPGAYDVTDALVRRGVPSARFGTGVAGLADVAAAVPGPGAYSPNLHASSTVRATPAGPTFANAPRLVDGNDAAVEGGAGGVGPGSYDPRLAAPSSGAPRFGSAPRLTDPSAAAAIAAGYASDVGPGSYCIDTADALVHPRAPAHRIAMSGAAQRQDAAQAATSAPDASYPGPGSYAYPVEVQGHARAALLLGRHPEPAGTAGETPGPGAYDIAAASAATHPAAPASTFGTAPTQRAPAALQEAQQQRQPGPGAYDAAAAFLASQVARVPGGFTMQGRASAGAVGVAEGPGPGAYDITGAGAATSAAAHRFGTAPRMPPSGSAADGSASAAGAGIGPGAYDLPPPPPSHAATTFPQAPRALGGTDAQRDQLPGPGAYDISAAAAAATQGAHAPSFTIPRGARPPLRSGDADASALVGPGTYSPVDAAAMRFAAVQPGPSAAFGLAERPAAGGLRDVPGPGTYDTHVAAAAGTRFGTAARMEPLEPGSSTTPGPGAYDISGGTASGAAVAGVRFGTALRPSLADPNDIPGPGSYNLGGLAVGRAAAAAAATTFGSATRPDVLLNTNPGPGTYDVVWTGGADAAGRGGGASFGLAARPSPVLNTSPGPGAYAYDAALHGFSVFTSGVSTFGLAVQRPHPAAHRVDTPGPGAYDRASVPSDAYAPSFGLGARMGAVHGAGTPGPGAYHTTALGQAAGLAGPTFAQAERPGPDLNAYPGPGAYYRDRAADPSRGAGFGRGERASPVRNDNPGPGTYFRGEHGGLGQRATTFGVGERPDLKLNDNPGPGTYFRDTLPPPSTALPASASAARAQPPRRPSAADTLRKLASVGYPTQEAKSASA